MRLPRPAHPSVVLQSCPPPGAPAPGPRHLFVAGARRVAASRCARSALQLVWGGGVRVCAVTSGACRGPLCSMPGAQSPLPASGGAAVPCAPCLLYLCVPVRVRARASLSSPVPNAHVATKGTFVTQAVCGHVCARSENVMRTRHVQLFYSRDLEMHKRSLLLVLLLVLFINTRVHTAHS